MLLKVFVKKKKKEKKLETGPKKEEVATEPKFAIHKFKTEVSFYLFKYQP